MKHLNITIYGRVQGVGFRRAAKIQAQYLGIKGLAKNMSDGSVNIEAEGETAVLDEFVKWCRKGPAYAQVNDIHIMEDSLKNYTAFGAGY